MIFMLPLLTIMINYYANLIC
uniref:Uncharacterized protein n=1 Tax=Arundo donax TaxID=35708 RepID=A0A0A9A8B6_ARUDO